MSLQVIINEIGDEPFPALSRADHPARAANRVRQNTHPRDPLDLEFELCQEHLPDAFLKADIKNGTENATSNDPSNRPTT